MKKKTLILICLMLSAFGVVRAASIKNTLYSCDFLEANIAGVTGQSETQTFTLNDGSWKAAAARFTSGEFFFGCGSLFDLKTAYDTEFSHLGDMWQTDYTGDVSKARWTNAMELDLELEAVKSIAFRWSAATGSGASNFSILVYALIGEDYQFLGTKYIVDGDNEIVCELDEPADVKRIALISVVTIANPRSLKLTECEVLGEDVESNKLPAPQFSIANDIQIRKGTIVTISCPDVEGETICYSTNGTTYREAREEVSVAITENTTLRAYCKMKGEEDSEETSVDYTVFDVNPTFEIADGEYIPYSWTAGSIASSSVDKVTDAEKGECLLLTNNTIQTKKLSTEQILMTAGKYKYAVDFAFDQCDEEYTFSLEYAFGTSTSYKKVAQVTPSEAEGWLRLEGEIELPETRAIRLAMSLVGKTQTNYKAWSVKVTNVSLESMSSEGENPNAVCKVEAATRVWVRGGDIIVDAISGEHIDVYDMNGRRVRTMTVAEDGLATMSELPHGGIYLVKIGDAQAAKVALH